MKYQSAFIAMILSAALIGCAGTAGNQKLADASKESITQNIVEGKTTQAQVKAMFGEPNTTSFTDGGNDVYNYAFSRASSQGVNYIPIVNLFARGYDVNTLSETQSETKGGVGK